MFLQQLVPYSCYGGLDLAAVDDLTAFVLAWPIGTRTYIYPWFFIPEEGLADRVKRDNVPYDRWAEDGLIELTPGNVTDWDFVRERIKILAGIFDIREIGYDSYNARDTSSKLIEVGLSMAIVNQSFMGMSAAAKRLQALVLSRRLVHSGHAVLRWNIDCCTITQDPAGNIKPVKPDRKKSNKRIDGVVASIMAVERTLENNTPGPAKAEVW